jgi:hypothetical protein
VVGRRGLVVRSQERLLVWHRTHTRGGTQCVMNFSLETQQYLMRTPQQVWVKVLDSSDGTWAGPGSILPNEIHGRERITLLPRSIAVFESRLPDTMRTQAVEAAATAVEETTDAYPAGDL